MTILEDIQKTKFNYCHALEVSTVYELEEVTSLLFQDFRENYSEDEIIDFFNTISVYALEEEEEEEIYSFNFENFIKELD
tara:strand:- start:829 stop:1068 length:240 start_codon:yes stop_codon:yes gene_type:complete